MVHHPDPAVTDSFDVLFVRLIFDINCKMQTQLTTQCKTIIINPVSNYKTIFAAPLLPAAAAATYPVFTKLLLALNVRCKHST